MNIDPRQLLQSVFGFDDFRQGQQQVIEALLAGRSAFALFPTGSGKSLCFQLPALLMDGVTLVVSPLIALMKDQIDFLRSKGIAAARLDSSLTTAEFKQVWADMDAGTLKLLYVSPERFNSERFVASISRRVVAMMVIDEAHCISEWGHNFRPDYLKLTEAATTIGAQRVLALTATAVPAVAEDIRNAFQIEPGDVVHTGFYRPNLTLAATPCTPAQRPQLLLQRLRKRERGATIVYVTRQQTAEEIAALLAEHGFPARHYHAGLSPEERHETQDWFMADPTAVVVATIAFGMGIDKADIRQIYHYNLPGALENYAQEIGRAGRDGRQAICEIIACEEDMIALQNFSYGDTPSLEDVQSLVDEVMTLGDVFDVSTYDLSNRHDIRNLVVSTLLCYLELEGCIEATGPFYSGYQIDFNTPQDRLIAGFDPRRQAFLQALFGSGKMGKTWLTIEIDEAAAALRAPRDRIVKALNYLEEQGAITLKVRGLRLGYRRRRTVNTQELATVLHTRFEEAEGRNIERIQRVLAFTHSGNCLTNGLLHYFGVEREAPCGHCDRCAGVTPSIPAQRQMAPIPETLATELRPLLHQCADALATPRALARFLCGLSSPRTSACRPQLTRHPLFGVLAGCPFATIHSYTQDLLG